MIHNHPEGMDEQHSGSLAATPTASTKPKSTNDKKLSVFNVKANQRIYAELVAEAAAKKAYIETLEALLREHNIEIPERPISRSTKEAFRPKEGTIGLLKEASAEAVQSMLVEVKKLKRNFDATITFRDLGYWTMAPEPHIPTVGSELKEMIFGKGPKHRVDLLKGITGRLLPRRMTLLLGPPGGGKSLLLKALCGRLRDNNATIEGSILYNGEPLSSDKFLVEKISDYIGQDDIHAATLTVEETVAYAWQSTSGGKHAYAFARNDETAKQLLNDDLMNSKVKNVLAILGLSGVKDTIVGDASIRGVSGGQKRRVTLAEMAVAPRIVKFMDGITNGLDSATAFDIVRACRDLCHFLDSTILISLLQPPPEVYDLFDEVMLLSEGQIIFHGARTDVLPYFEGIGYFCPDNVDVADFLQEIPKIEGHRYIKDIPNQTKDKAPRGTTALVASWKASAYYLNMLEEMDGKRPLDQNDIEMGQVYQTTQDWPEDLREPYPISTIESFKLALERQVKIVFRDKAFVGSRIAQSLVVAGIAGSLFANIETTDYPTMNGFLFFACLFGALSNFPMIPLVFAQKQVFYKQYDALFLPAASFTLSQALVLVPLQLVESILFGTIMYWSAGLSSDYNGGRFLTFILISFMLSLVLSQFFRLVSFIMPTNEAAQPVCGVFLVLQVLFSGFIQPKSQISNGWIWYYWLNPVAYALRAVTVNQYKSTAYDFLVPTDVTGTNFQRFGDVILEQYGNPTEEAWIWYSFAVLIAEYILFFVLSNLAIRYVRLTASPPPPIIVPDDEAQKDLVDGAVNSNDVSFDPVTFAFRDIWYTVTLPGGEELDLLRGVSGFFEPGTVTALMGSSGAGKTTLLDVLSGRKNTGVVKGEMFINGVPKDDHHFRRIAGYVEQFDSLSPHDTAREAIEFSAALRLSSDIPYQQKADWVDAVLEMLELKPLESSMIGTPETGGMSFEQKKRVSIGVELAANPSILFLDEPTTGLDSRAAQVVTRSIRRVASSGRSVVCTIHQPSIPIFSSFDSLLLLRRGGQTVFFGNLGENCEDLIRYFTDAPNVVPIKARQNPATWMLEVIGAGTSSSALTVDFHAYYKESELCLSNSVRVDELCTASESTTHKESKVTASSNKASYAVQFYWLYKKVLLSYWRTPQYNLVRFLVSVIIALIFASAYPNFETSTGVAVVSKSAVIFITCLFCGVVGMQTVMPVILAERPAFYREQQSEMYSVAVYSVVVTLVEIPYLVLSSLTFTLPFFYIVGFQNTGVESDKFGWYWLFQGLYTTVLVFLGHAIVALLPTAQACDIAAGLISTLLSMFCGFMIRAQNIPTFWLFMYWLDPLHYAIEGLNESQFHGDESVVTDLGGGVTTAENYISAFYSTWKYTEIRICVMALWMFIIFLRVISYYGLAFLRHDKR